MTKKKATLWKEEKPGVYPGAGDARRWKNSRPPSACACAPTRTTRRSTRWAGLSSCARAGCRRGARSCRMKAACEFEIVDADPRRIKRLRVRLPGAAAARPLPPCRRPAEGLTVRLRAGPDGRPTGAAFGLGAVMAPGQAPLGFWWLALPALAGADLRWSRGGRERRAGGLAGAVRRDRAISRWR